MDRGGNFLGTLRILGGNRPFNLGPALLEAGLAKLHPSFDPDRVQGGRELAAAQEHAQKGKVKVYLPTSHKLVSCIHGFAMCAKRLVPVCTVTLGCSTFVQQVHVSTCPVQCAQSVLCLLLQLCWFEAKWCLYCAACLKPCMVLRCGLKHSGVCIMLCV